MQAERHQGSGAAEQPAPEGRGGRATLELCFITVVGVVVVAAFVAALGYDPVSARAPLCIIVPLLILIGLQFRRTQVAARREKVFAELSAAIQGHSGEFNTVAAFIGWMVLLLLLIFVAGHYIGIAAFMFMLLRVIARERLLLSFLVTAGVTAIIYVLFEHGFNIELYRGLAFRMLADYDL